MKHLRILYGIGLAALAAPFSAFAQFGLRNNFGPTIGAGLYPVPGLGIGGPSFYGQTRGLQITSFQGILALLNTLLGYMQVGIFLVALFFFLRGAYLIVTGDMAGCGKMLLNAAIGVAAAILAFSIIPLVCFVTQSNGPACWL